MMNTVNTQNLQQNVVQESYNDIIRIIDGLIDLLRHDSPQGNNSAAQGSNSAASA